MMSMTFEQAQALKVGDQIELNRNGQRFTITGITPQATANKIVLLLETEDGVHTFIDEKRLNLISPAGTNYKPAAVEPQNPPLDQLVGDLRETVEASTQDLTVDDHVDTLANLRENLLGALEESVEDATEEVSLSDDKEDVERRIESQFTGEPELTKPAKRGRRGKKA